MPNVLFDQSIPNSLPIPDIKVIASPYVRTERDKLILGFAFMHCSLFDDEGDIEFGKEGERCGGFLRNEVPDDFKSFFAAYRESGATGFHARCNASDVTSPLGFSQCALVSRGYDFLYTSMCGSNGKAIFHPGMSQNKELHRNIIDETFELYEKVKKGLPIPPVKERENEHPLKCYAVLKRDGKYKAKPSDFSAPEGCYSLCNRPDFKFTCLKSIQCCGQCEMLEKSYQILIDEALEEESAAKLKKMVEEAGLFSKGENGKPINCQGRKCGTEKSDESTCSVKSVNAVEAIRSLWFCCFHT